MTESEEKIKKPYFVALGREVGGFLEVLGLGPGADRKQVGAAEKGHRRKIKQEILGRQKKLKKQLDANEITREEFDRSRKDNESEQTQRLMKLNKLKESYEKVQAQRRKNEKKGIVDDNATWFNVYPETDKCGAALASLCLDSVLTAHYGHQPGAREGRQPRMDYLFWADDCWAKLKWTNRGVWRERIFEWANEVRESRLKFHFSGKSVDSETALFPELCWPVDRSVKSLENDEMEDFSKKPERKIDEPDLDLAGLLARMLSMKADTKRAKSAKGVDMGLDKKRMLAMLKMLEIAAAKGKK